MDTKIVKRWGEVHPGLCVETVVETVVERISSLVLTSSDQLDIVPSIYFVGNEKIMYSLKLPDNMKNIKFRGSCYGWLISVGLDGRIQMLEPFTNTHIDLPPLSTFSDIIDYQSDRLHEEYSIKSPVDDDIYTRDKLGVLKIHVNKIILSSPPRNQNQDDFMAIAIYGEMGRLAYTTRNSNKWTDFSTLNLNPKPKPAAYCDAIFHKGKIYALDVRGFTWKYDIESKVGKKMRIPPQHLIGCHDRRHQHAMYLVGNNDKLFLVLRHIMIWMQNKQGEDEDETKFFYHTCGFDVYKLSQKKWVKVKNLGDYVFVIGSSSSRCVSTHTIAGVKRNRIYYSDDYLDLQYKEEVGGHDIGFFNLEDGTSHSFFPHTPLVLPAPLFLF